MKHYAHFLVVFGLVNLFSGFSVFAQTKPSASPVEINTLDFSQTVEREMASGQKHFYKIKLEAGQFARVVVEQRGVDIAFVCLSPEGQNILEFKNEAEGGSGVETARIAAETAGDYILRVVALHGATAAGNYSLKFSELRAAADKELSFTNGIRLMNEANNVGKPSATTETLKKTIEIYRQAVEKLRLAGPVYCESSTLTNIINLYGFLGDRKTAIEYGLQAAQFAKKNNFRLEEANALQGVGLAYAAVGEPEKALEALFRARTLEGETDNPFQTAYTNTNIGLVYWQIGDVPRAMIYFEQAVVLARANDNRHGEILAYIYLGKSHASLGDSAKAVDYLQKALSLTRKINDRRREIFGLINLARVQFKFGEYEKCLENLNQSLIISRELDDKPNMAASLQMFGQVYLTSGNTEKALEYLKQALEARQAVEDTFGLAENLMLLAKAENQSGLVDAAQTHAEEAIRLIEQVRARVKVADLRDSFSANLQDFYGFYVELLMQRDKLAPDKNYAALALQANERARARGLLNLLAESNADIRQGVDAKFLDKEIELRNLLAARMENLTRVLSGKHTPEQAEKLKKEVEQIRADYQQTQAQIRRTSPRYAALTQPKTLSLAEIQTEVLDADSVLLEYALGAEKSFLWIVTKDSFQTVELPKRAEIEKAARLTYDALTARNKRVKFETTDERRSRIEQADADFLNLSKDLSKTILAPAAQFLKKKRLLIVADGALQYIPFAALRIADSKLQIPNSKTEAESGVWNLESGIKYLVETNEIINLPSVSTLAILRREMNGRLPAPKTLAVLADPVFDVKDERFQASGAKKKLAPKFETVAFTKNKDGDSTKNLKRAARDFDLEDEEGINLPRLPFTRREADSISASLPVNQRSKMLGFDATRNAVFNAELSNYRYVHFATHSFLNNKNPELSGIVLSLFDENGKEQDGFLRVGEVFNLKLPAELVVLSGCRTGLGKEIKGEGLVGLTRGFMYAGAKRVVVSLWDVNDEGTSELMANFYREMLGTKKLSPASALRQAQISMLKEKRWQNPYFWATFTLQGEPQ